MELDEEEIGLPEWTQKWTKHWVDLRQLSREILNTANIVHSKEDFVKSREKFKLLLRTLKRLASHETRTENDCRSMAYAYFRIFKYDKAKEYYQLALQLEPNSYYAHNGLGTTFYRMFAYEEAIDECRQALAIRPQYLEAVKNLGNALYGLGRYQEEIDLYDNAFRNLGASKDLFLLNNCGYSLKELRKFDEAIEYFKKGMEIEPKYQYVYNGLGSVYKDLKRYEEAVELFKKAIELDPRYEKAHYNLGLTLIKLKDYEQAEEKIRTGINFNRITNRTDFFSNHCHGVALYKLGRYNEAIRRFTDTSVLVPHIIYRYLTHYYHAMSLLKLSSDSNDNIIMNNGDDHIDYDAVLEKLNESIRENENWSKGYYRRGEVYLKKKSLENAKSDFLKAIQFNESPFPSEQLSDKKINLIQEKIREIDQLNN